MFWIRLLARKECNWYSCLCMLINSPEITSSTAHLKWFVYKIKLQFFLILLTSPITIFTQTNRVAIFTLKLLQICYPNQVKYTNYCRIHPNLCVILPWKQPQLTTFILDKKLCLLLFFDQLIGLSINCSLIVEKAFKIIIKQTKDDQKT